MDDSLIDIYCIFLKQNLKERFKQYDRIPNIPFKYKLEECLGNNCAVFAIEIIDLYYVR